MEFERRAEVLAEQFNGYAVADDAHVNGHLTLGENTTNLGGVAIAFAATQETVGRTRPEWTG